MAWQVLVDGVDKTTLVVQSSFAIHRRLGSETLEMTLLDPAASYDVPAGAVIRVLDGAVEVFEGLERITTKTDLDRLGPRVLEVKAVDYNVLLDMDVIKAAASRSVSEGDKARIAWLVSTYGTKGVTAGAEVVELVASLPVGDDGNPRQDLGWQPLGAAIQAVAQFAGAGGRFYVDRDKKLHYGLLDGAIAAPFGLSTSPNGSTTFGMREFVLTEDKIDTVHRVVVRGANGVQETVEVSPLPPAAQIVERTFIDSTITTSAQAIAAGNGYLALNGTAQMEGKCEVFQPGLDPGMTIQITHSVYGLVAEPFLIASIDVTLDGVGHVRYGLQFGRAKPDLASLARQSARTVEQIEAITGDLPGEIAQSIADLSVAGANLVPNSSFENSALVGWTNGANWTFAFDPTEEPFDRVKVARASATAQAVGELLSPALPVVRTDDYWASFWSFVRATNGACIAELREFSNAAGTTLVQTTTLLSDSTADTAWTRYVKRFGPNDQLGRTPFHANTVSVRFVFRLAGTPTVTWDVDGVQLERGELSTAYAPAPYELMDGSIIGDHILPGAIRATEIADGAILTPKLAAGSVTTNQLLSGAVTTDKLAALAIVAGKIAAGVITSDKIATSGIVADKIVGGHLSVGGAGETEYIVVKDASGNIIGRWDADGLIIKDTADPDLQVRLLDGVMAFSEDGGATWPTAISGYGISADAIRFGTSPGGHNAIPDASFELAAFVTALSKVWTVTADWAATIGTTVNIDGSGSDLNMTTVTY